MIMMLVIIIIEHNEAICSTLLLNKIPVSGSVR